MTDLVERLRGLAAIDNCQVSIEAADRIEQLTSALRWIDEQRYVDRSTINQDNAFRKAVSLNERLVKIMDTARAELAAPSGAMEKRT